MPVNLEYGMTSSIVVINLVKVEEIKWITFSRMLKRLPSDPNLEI